MEPITSETILILAGSFLCVFVSLVTVGGAFLYWRTRQLNNSSLPEPTPPAVTRDAHAKPLGETPTRDETVEEHSWSSPPTVQDTATPVPPTGVPLGAEPAAGSATQTLSRPLVPPLGMDFDTVDDADEASETVTRELKRTTPKHIQLPTQSDSDNTPTVIIDRSKPMNDDKDEQ